MPGLTATEIGGGGRSLMTLASKIPLIGGGGIDTFMNRAFALPSTGVAYTPLRGGAGDRVVLSADEICSLRNPADRRINFFRIVTGY